MLSSPSNLQDLEKAHKQLYQAFFIDNNTVKQKMLIRLMSIRKVLLLLYAIVF